MGLVRHGLGLSRTESRFPGKGTCLAIYSRAVNAREPLEEVLKARFPWCAGWDAELQALFAGYVEAKQAAHVLDYDDLLLYWAEMLADPAAADGARGGVRPCAGRRVPGHQPAAGGDPSGAEARRPGRDGGGGRRAGDLRVPGGGGAQHPRLSRRVSSRRRGW